MRADELHECNLPAEVERDNHSIISAGNLEPNPLAVQNLRLWRRPLNVMAGLPVGGAQHSVPALERRSRFRVLLREAVQDALRDDAHERWISCSRFGNKNEVCLRWLSGLPPFAFADRNFALARSEEAAPIVGGRL